MSETKPFAITIPLPEGINEARALCSDLGLRVGRNLKDCHAALHYLSEQMRLVATPVKPEYKEDPFPPLRNSKRLMQCSHCLQNFTEDKIKFRHKLGHSLGPMWWCPTPGCDGAGVGHDIDPAPEGASEGDAA